VNLHLESWLSSAMLGLALFERRRIYEEISAHVADAIAHQTAQGLSAPDAEARAIQDLGDPQAARVAFQRTCYTLADEIRLEKLLGRSWWTLPCAWLVLVIPASFFISNWLGTPIKIQSNINLPNWQITFIAFIFASLFFTLLYLEPQIKKYLHQRFSSFGVIAVQTFMALISSAMISGALTDIFNIVQSALSGQLKFSIGTWIIVPVLTYRWIAQQTPLTLKTIRRTRA
jgi:hypothetical protein